MFSEMVFRFLVGGLIVSLFAALGDIFRPKSFAGLMGAAPSVALATLTLTIHSKGGAYGAVEGRSMIMGAVALCLFSQFVAWAMFRTKASLPTALAGAFVVWFIVAFGLHAAALR